jgi:hypothetical protein
MSNIDKMKRRFLLTAVVFLLMMKCILPQTSSDTVKSNIDWGRLAIVGGVTAAWFTFGYVVQNNLWWKGDKSKFHFEWKHDWTYALGEDKFGHFFFPYLLTNIYSQAFEWTGMDKSKSLLYAASFSLFYETFVEIRDGFSKQWGFSWGDFSADFLGAFYPVLQNKIPVLKNFNFKISFYPSERFRNGSNKVIFDDYESTYDWLSVNVHNLLPISWRKYYPAFINIAVGHSVKKLDTEDRHHEFYIGLDWNLKALPGNGWFAKLLKRNLNYYHLPAPAIKIYRGTVWYGLKF